MSHAVYFSRADRWEGELLEAIDAIAPVEQMVFERGMKRGRDGLVDGTKSCLVARRWKILSIGGIENVFKKM